MKGFKLRNKDEYASLSVRPMIGPIERRILKRLWNKANEMNNLEDVQHNGKTYKTTEGKFRVMDGSIRFVPNRSTK